MARRNKITHITDIRNLRELRDVRRDLELKAWYTRQRLEDNVENTFSVDNIVSIIAPPGSALDRIIGGAATGFATLRGIINGIQAFRARR